MDRSRRSGSVDDAVRYVIQDLGIRLPLALMLVTTLPEELNQRLQSIDYVERDTLTPVPTDHLAGRGADVDFEIWLDTGDTPLPQRLAITYKNEEGAPQYRAEFSDWKLNPDVSPVDLAFNPPDGAQRIPFLVRVRRPPATSHPQPVKPLPIKRQPIGAIRQQGRTTEMKPSQQEPPSRLFLRLSWWSPWWLTPAARRAGRWRRRWARRRRRGRLLPFGRRGQRQPLSAQRPASGGGTAARQAGATAAVRPARPDAADRVAPGRVYRTFGAARRDAADPHPGAGRYADIRPGGADRAVGAAADGFHRAYRRPSARVHRAYRRPPAGPNRAHRGPQQCGAEHLQRLGQSSPSR